MLPEREVSCVCKMKPVSLYFLCSMNCSFLQKSKPKLCWDHLAESQLHDADLLWHQTFCYYFRPTHKPTSKDPFLLRLLSIIRPSWGRFDTSMCLGFVWCTSLQQFYVIYTYIIHIVLTIMTTAFLLPLIADLISTASLASTTYMYLFLVISVIACYLHTCLLLIYSVIACSDFW